MNGSAEGGPLFVQKRHPNQTHRAQRTYRPRLQDPEVENLRVVFELLDTGCTGKIHFEHFVLHSGMKDEVLKGFMRRASKEGITTDITFPKLVKLVFPKLAHRYRTHEVLASETVKKNREDEAGILSAADRSVLTKKGCREIHDIFAGLEKDDMGCVSFQTMLDTFGGNNLFSEDEFVVAMHSAAGTTSLRHKVLAEHLAKRRAQAELKARQAANTRTESIVPGSETPARAIEGGRVEEREAGDAMGLNSDSAPLCPVVSPPDSPTDKGERVQDADALEEEEEDICEHDLRFMDCSKCLPPLVGPTDKLTLQQFTALVGEFYPVGNTAPLDAFIRVSKKHFEAKRISKEKALKRPSFKN